jgi:hypothetical protein
MVEQPGVLVEYRRTSEEALVEGPTPLKVAHGESHMSKAGEFGHVVLLARVAATIGPSFLRFLGNFRSLR